MIISINHQFGLVVFSLVSGLITGVLFDFYRVIRGSGNSNKIITFIEDVMFWIFTAIVVFIFLLYFNYAYIGMYVYLWISIGIYLYIKLVSKFFIASHYKLFKLFGRVFRVTKNTLLYPFQLIIHTFRIKNKGKYKK